VTPATYSTLVWLVARLGVLFAVGVPLVLLVWAALRREAALLRLLELYWKVSSLLLIGLLLHVADQPVAYALVPLGLVLLVVVPWFWVDLNEELHDLPPWRPLPLTVRIWRWCLTLLGAGATALSLSALSCMAGAAVMASPRCLVWRQGPQLLNGALDRGLDFVLGGDWTPVLAGFAGYLALLAYAVGLLQWLLVRLPRQGRVAGDF
jgi:hypothetical protein